MINISMAEIDYVRHDYDMMTGFIVSPALKSYGPKKQLDPVICLDLWMLPAILNHRFHRFS
jgi:hypothetical protein